MNSIQKVYLDVIKQVITFWPLLAMKKNSSGDRVFFARIVASKNILLSKMICAGDIQLLQQDALLTTHAQTKTF